jgi:hypothetical protein
VHNNDKSNARDLCYSLLQEQDIHFFYQVKYHLMLAGLADVPPVMESHLDETGRLCTQLFEGRKKGEEEEILAYRDMSAIV